MLFTVDLMHPDFDAHPGLDGMLVYEVILEPGDILFHPGGVGATRRSISSGAS